MSRALAASVLALGLASLALGKMMMPKLVPTDRLLPVAKEYAQAHPKDADVWYAIGRIYYAMYCEEDPRAIRMYSDVPPFRFDSGNPYVMVRGERDATSAAARRDYVLNAIANLGKAISLDQGRQPGLYSLTMACVYEASAPAAKSVQPGATKQDFLDEAYRWYRRSYDQSRARDRKSGRFGVFAGPISQEAGEAMLRLKPDKDAKAIQAYLKELRQIPMMVTPIVFHLGTPRPLEALLDSARRVDFDLNGTGQAPAAGWVRPDTAILVWQPDPRVPITSGRQLFGSATWWMMYRDGYAAMAALDADGNGWLEGGELFGLAVWQDRNGDGVWQPGETTPATAAGISGLATASTGSVGSSLVSAFGLRTTDGRVLPTYDWVVQAR